MLWTSGGASHRIAPQVQTTVGDRHTPVTPLYDFHGIVRQPDAATTQTAMERPYRRPTQVITMACLSSHLLPDATTGQGPDAMCRGFAARRLTTFARGEPSKKRTLALLYRSALIVEANRAF